MSVEHLSEYREIVDIIKEAGGDPAKACYQCGLCDTVCPWNRVTEFSMRRIVREATFGLTEIENEEIWRCTTCGRCPQQCPRDVQQIQVSMALRRMATEFKVFPTHVQGVRGAAASLASEGNPLGEPRADRTKWTEGMKVPAFTEGMDILYFTCCYVAYDPRLKKVARATAELLSRAGVDYGILGTKENCCGESIRKAGNEDLFKHLARENIKTFVDHGVQKILVSSPHCYHTFKNEYPEFRANFEVVSVSECLAQLLADGRLEVPQEVAKKVAYHDPCYLGRHNGIYDQPRDVLESIPGVELSELPDARVDSLCCGGGGGRIWMDTPKEERFSDLRVDQAIAVGAEVLATSCPYCIATLEESRQASEAADTLEVKDITEILLESMA